MKSIIAKINLAVQTSEEIQKKEPIPQVNRIPELIPVKSENPFSISDLTQNSSIDSTSNRNIVLGSNNPFGESFSQLNDNDLFGLEFDLIRQNNSNSSLNQNSGK